MAESVYKVIELVGTSSESWEKAASAAIARAGASSDNVGDESTRSEALAAPSATAVVSPVASTVTSAGAVTVGGVVSSTVTL